MTPEASGLVIVDKPGGMTSHDVVARVRRLAGTLPRDVRIAAADVARDAGNPVQIAEALSNWLTEQGYFSHGIVDAGEAAKVAP